ncbi:helix-turn-helix transcriptional regulator [uncultured Ruminococcus sp.]|uniref:helix-turn-helix domain-containing protein n=1 Tax=uncultured Ruminococcus sp. TaxID=165186 RepID=UPI0025FBFB6D|nr:helix-turn-helix transcriptional regulator [uncultured Ruminococcus sp.]
MSENPYYRYFSDLLSDMSPKHAKTVCEILSDVTEERFCEYVNDHFNKDAKYEYFLETLKNPSEPENEFQPDFDFRRIPESHQIYEAFKEIVDDTLQTIFEDPRPPEPSRWEKIGSFLSDAAYDLISFLLFILTILFYPILLIIDIFRFREEIIYSMSNSVLEIPEGSRYDRIMDAAMDAVSEAVQDSFANRLRRIQERRDISASEIVQASDISNGSFSKYLSEQSFPDKNTVLKMLIGCQLSPEESTELLNSVGYDWFDCETDKVVRRYIKEGVFDIKMLNDELERRGLMVLKGNRKYMEEKSVNSCPDEKSFPKLLSVYQERAHLTNEQCADKIGVSYRCWAQYRASCRHPERIKLLKIAILLKCSRQETEELLRSCQFHIVESSIVDQIVINAIDNELYDLDMINELIENAKKAGKS